MFRVGSGGCSDMTIPAKQVFLGSSSSQVKQVAVEYYVTTITTKQEWITDKHNLEGTMLNVKR